MSRNRPQWGPPRVPVAARDRGVSRNAARAAARRPAGLAQSVPTLGEPCPSDQRGADAAAGPDSVGTALGGTERRNGWLMAPPGAGDDIRQVCPP